MRKFVALMGMAGVAVAVGACTSGGSGGGGNGTPTPTPAARTWYEDVAPIVMQNCAGCHRPGGIAPFSLLTYADATPMGPAMKSYTGSRLMPPSTVDVSGACNSYSDARYLSDAEIQTIADWVDQGMPEGNPANAPPTPAPLPTLSNITTTVDIGGAYTPPASGGTDLYRCFIADPGLAADTYMTGFDITPGDPKIVHHVVVFTLDNAQAVTDAQTLDANDPGQGYTCFGGSGVNNNSRLLLAWAPGEGATTLANGTGIQLSAGMQLVIQVHYNLLQGTGTDDTQVNLQTSPTVTTPAQMAFLSDSGFTIPPGQQDYQYTYDIGPSPAGHIYSVFPHMHKLGRSMKLEVVHNGTAQCATDVPRWDFNWQQFHTYQAPIQVQSGDTLRVTCHWNSTTESSPVTFGEGTTDEMCVFGLFFSVP